MGITGHVLQGAFHTVELQSDRSQSRGAEPLEAGGPFSPGFFLRGFLRGLSTGLAWPSSQRDDLKLLNCCIVVPGPSTVFQGTREVLLHLFWLRHAASPPLHLIGYPGHKPSHPDSR